MLRDRRNSEPAIKTGLIDRKVEDENKSVPDLGQPEDEQISRNHSNNEQTHSKNLKLYTVQFHGYSYFPILKIF